MVPLLLGGGGMPFKVDLLKLLHLIALEGCHLSQSMRQEFKLPLLHTNYPHHLIKRGPNQAQLIAETQPDVVL